MKIVVLFLLVTIVLILPVSAQARLPMESPVRLTSVQPCQKFPDVSNAVQCVGIVDETLYTDTDPNPQLRYCLNQFCSSPMGKKLMYSLTNPDDPEWNPSDSSWVRFSNDSDSILFTPGRTTPRKTYHFLLSATNGNSNDTDAFDITLAALQQPAEAVDPTARWWTYGLAALAAAKTVPDIVKQISTGWTEINNIHDKHPAKTTAVIGATGGAVVAWAVELAFFYRADEDKKPWWQPFAVVTGTAAGAGIFFGLLQCIVNKCRYSVDQKDYGTVLVNK